MNLDGQNHMSYFRAKVNCNTDENWKNTTQQRFELSSNGPKTLKESRKTQKDLWNHGAQVSNIPTFHICERKKKVNTKE